jgi:hypothetical protein
MTKDENLKELAKLLAPTGPKSIPKEDLIKAGAIIDELFQEKLDEKESRFRNDAFVKIAVHAKPELKVENLVRALLAAEK